MMAAAPSQIASRVIADKRTVLRELADKERLFKLVELVPDELTLSAEFLEFLLSVASITEAASVLGADTLAAVLSRADEIIRLSGALAGLDVVEVMGRNRGTLPPESGLGADSQLPVRAALDAYVRFAKSVVATCPIVELEAVGARTARAELAARCRRAFDRLTSFIRRHDPSLDAQFAVAGRAFVEGRLTLDEIASIFDMPRPEAVALLEKLGLSRPIEQIRLPEDKRRALLARIAAERQSRDGQPAFSEELVKRDVVATQRIENVDARPWLEPGPINS